MYVKQINLYNQDYNIKDAFGRAMIAADFKSTQNYEIGDFVLSGNQLYKCLSSTTGSWDSRAWSSTTIIDNLGGRGEGYNFDITQDEWNTIVAINNQTISGTLSLSGVTEIADYMFQSCSNLEEVNFPDCIKVGKSTFQSCTSLQIASFPVCKSIDNYTFHDCSSLQLASFPSCISIGAYAFQACISLQSADFPACITIGYMAFFYCSSLQTISFPACTSIGEDAFNGCFLLQSADFPACTSIGQYAFCECSSLSALYLLSSSICTLANSNTFMLTPMESSKYLGYFGSIYVPSSLVDTYKTATNWTYYADRIVGV